MAQSVYFIECEGRIKIGFSVDVARRMREIGAHAPGNLTLLGMVEGGPDLERAIHQKLALCRLKNEWFADCAEVRTLLDLLKERGPSAIDFGTKRRPREVTRETLSGEPAANVWLREYERFTALHDRWLSEGAVLDSLLPAPAPERETLTRPQLIQMVNLFIRAADGALALIDDPSFPGPELADRLGRHVDATERLAHRILESPEGLTAQH